MSGPLITCLSGEASNVLFNQALIATEISGEMAELGVFKGGSAAMIALVGLPSGKTVHLFDTFAGFPDGNHGGMFSDTSLEYVMEQLSPLPNVQFHVGLFQETSPAMEGTVWCFVHLDGDLYETTRAGLEFFYPAMSVGGIILLDDFGRDDWPGVEKAAREFMTGRPEEFEIVGEHQARIVKL